MALSTPVGMIIIGPLVDVISVQVLLIAAGIATIIVITVAIMLPSGRAAIAASNTSDGDDEPDVTPEPDAEVPARN